MGTSRKVSFEYAVKSFTGYLEGTQKSAHTIKNYRSDLATFQQYLREGMGTQPVALTSIQQRDLDRYNEYLRALGLKTNSRRRKILTIRRLLRYLTKRNKLSVDVSDRIPAPHKVERIPWTMPMQALMTLIQAMPATTELAARNRLLCWTLAETGCQVSELCRCRFDQWRALGGSKAELHLTGKNERDVPVSRELFEAVNHLKSLQVKESPWVFPGFNRFGALGGPISSRGVEILVRGWAERENIPQLSPRTIRHCVVRHWYETGIRQEEIKRLLGLKSDYAFRVYNPMFKTLNPRT